MAGDPTRGPAHTKTPVSLADAHPSATGGETAVDGVDDTMTVFRAGSSTGGVDARNARTSSGSVQSSQVVVVTPLDVGEAAAQHRLADPDAERVDGENVGPTEDLARISASSRR